MENAFESQIPKRLQAQRDYFGKGRTRDLNTRRDLLKRLKASIVAHADEIGEALHTDLHKSAYETYLTEISIVLHEIDTQVRHLKRWARTRKVGSPLFLWPSRSRIVCEPYGHVLILAPWNYPFQLLMAPLVSAVAAGNVVAAKPSHQTPRTAEIIRKILDSVFDANHVATFIGETAISTFLLAQRFDYIFFTGSPRVGRIVMESAAQYLELGGKSPCIVDRTADLDVAARRIVWGKLVNAGQTCIAPDYLLVDSKVKSELLEKMVEYIRKFYGDDPRESPDYPRIVGEKAAERLAGLIHEQEVYYGGQSDPAARYVAPTILNHVDPGSPVMQEEIFGPILPVLTVRDMKQAVHFINTREKPLALYYFGDRKQGRKVIRRTSSGGACINDTLLHIANPKLPFGGVGNSGMGNYHGKEGFDTFSHRRSVLISGNRVDFSIKYPPFKNVGLLKKMM